MSLSPSSHCKLKSPQVTLRYLSILFCLLLAVFSVGIKPTEARSSLCPFTRQFRPYSRCVTCRTCPYTENSCCLNEHESVIQESLEVLGSVHWNCRLTILYYQECGKCSPESHLFVSSNYSANYLNYSSSYDTKGVMPMQFNRNNGIRICKHNCEYIWNQCADVPIISYNISNAADGDYQEGDEYVVPPGMSKEEFCKDFPTEEEAKQMGIRCYSDALRNAYSSVVAVLLIAFVASVFIL